MGKGVWVKFAPFYLLVVIFFLGIAHLGSNAVTVMNQQAPVQRDFRIVIDAGHGGIDGGATSCTGVLESQINLEIALRLENLFHLLGYDTVMIRRIDESVYTQGHTIAAQKVSDLKERVRICNETQGAVLISIHQNTYPDSRYYGAQVLYAKNNKSAALGQYMQTQLNEQLGSAGNRKCKQGSSLYLLENITCPGILIECGFLTNPEEESKLRSANYQKQICGVITTAVSRYLVLDQNGAG